MSRRYKGKLLQLEKVRTLAGKKIEARSHAPVLTEVGVESDRAFCPRPGVLPASLEIVPSTRRLIIPQ